MENSLEEFGTIFGEAKAEWENLSLQPLYPFLYRAYKTNDSILRIEVSDFRSYTWESTLTIQQLEDLRDIIGIAGSWSEFVDYLKLSISSDNVKIVLGCLPNSGSVIFGKLVCRKSKGLPIVSISLQRLHNSAQSDYMANLALDLFKAFRSRCTDVLKEQERSDLLRKMLSSEEDKTKSLQNQLDSFLFSRKKKLPKMLSSDKESTSEQVSDFLSSQDSRALKSTQRVVPAYRRAKVRGALLQDTEDEPMSNQ